MFKNLGIEPNFYLNCKTVKLNSIDEVEVEGQV